MNIEEFINFGAIDHSGLQLSPTMIIASFSNPLRDFAQEKNSTNIHKAYA